MQTTMINIDLHFDFYAPPSLSVSVSLYKSRRRKIIKVQQFNVRKHKEMCRVLSTCTAHYEGVTEGRVGNHILVYFIA